jgi:hypothetical protein
MGMVDVAAFAATVTGPPDRNDHCDPAADQVGRQRRKPIILAIGPPVFHRHILVLDITLPSGLDEPQQHSARKLI